MILEHPSDLPGPSLNYSKTLLQKFLNFPQFFLAPSLSLLIISRLSFNSLHIDPPSTLPGTSLNSSWTLPQLFLYPPSNLPVPFMN